MGPAREATDLLELVTRAVDLSIAPVRHQLEALRDDLRQVRDRVEHLSTTVRVRTPEGTTEITRSPPRMVGRLTVSEAVALARSALVAVAIIAGLITTLIYLDRAAETAEVVRAIRGGPPSMAAPAPPPPTGDSP